MEASLEAAFAESVKFNISNIALNGSSIYTNDAVILLNGIFKGIFGQFDISKYLIYLGSIMQVQL